MFHRAPCRQAAVAANVLAPPSLTLEQVRELQERAAGSCEFWEPCRFSQEAEIVEYSKPDFQTLLRLAGALACGTLECFALKERAVHCSRNDPGEESSCAATALCPGLAQSCADASNVFAAGACAPHNSCLSTKVSRCRHVTGSIHM